jgi:hypothetical protein
VTVWSTTQILSQVPAVDSVPAYNGYAYLLRADGSRSSLMPFAFKPTLTVAQLQFNTKRASDYRIVDPHEIDSSNELISHPGNLNLFGFAGYDEFFMSTRLRNGWQTVQVALLGPNYCGNCPPRVVDSANVYLVESRIGTDSPYAKVRWWTDTWGGVHYRVTVTIQGPSGLPYQ